MYKSSRSQPFALTIFGLCGIPGLLTGNNTSQERDFQCSKPCNTMLSLHFHHVALSSCTPFSVNPNHIVTAVPDLEHPACDNVLTILQEVIPKTNRTTMISGGVTHYDNNTVICPFGSIATPHYTPPEARSLRCSPSEGTQSTFPTFQQVAPSCCSFWKMDLISVLYHGAGVSRSCPQSSIHEHLKKVQKMQDP
jgi:hypothetical protein